MAQVILRIPSKVPYGYVEVHADASEVENLPSPEMLATFYATYFKAYKEAEEKALFSGPSAPKSKAPQIKISDVLTEMSDGDHDTEESAVKALLVKELGAVEVEETGDEPWNQTTETEEKPWVAKASESDWDFS